MVNSTTEILILHCGTNDMKIDITSQEITQNIIRFAEGVTWGGNRNVSISQISNRGDNFNTKLPKVNKFLSNMNPGKNVIHK